MGSPAEKALLEITVAMKETMNQARVAAEAAGAAASSAKDAAEANQSKKGGVGLNLKFLEKPSRFDHVDPDEEDREFPEWKFNFEAWVNTQDEEMGVEMEKAARHDRVLQGLRAEEQPRSRVLYAVLLNLLGGRLRKLVRNVVDNNGYEAWRQINSLMMPRDRNRSLGMLQKLMSDTYWQETGAYHEKLMTYDMMVESCEKKVGPSRRNCASRPCCGRFQRRSGYTCNYS